MFIHCFDKRKRKRVLAGEYDVMSSTFTKKVKKNHYMFVEKGYGIQDEVLQDLESKGCINVVILAKDKQYKSLLTTWLKQPSKDYGHGIQRFLIAEEAKECNCCEYGDEGTCNNCFGVEGHTTEIGGSYVCENFKRRTL